MPIFSLALTRSLGATSQSRRANFGLLRALACGAYQANNTSHLLSSSRLVSRYLTTSHINYSPQKEVGKSDLSRGSLFHTNTSKTETSETTEQSNNIVRTQLTHNQEMPSHTHAKNADEKSTDHAHLHDLSHSHEHSHELSLFHTHTHQHNELLSKGFLTNPAVRITWIGLFVNVVMAGAKGLGGVYFHSQALVADAIHSVSDTVADFLTLATVNVANKEGTFLKYPLGYGKIESVGTFLVSGVLLAAGLTVGWSSLLQILEMLLPANIYEYLQVLQVHSHSHFSGSSGDHSHSHDSNMTLAERQLPDINAAWLALASIGVKELLFRKTMKIAEKTNSKVLVANAWHHRVDSLTASVAVVTVVLGVYFGVSWLDAVGGLLVSALIVNVGMKSLLGAWYELIDRGCDPKSEQFEQVKLIVEEATANVSKDANLDFRVSEFSLLSAGARSNVIVKMAADGNPSLANVCEFETDLIKAIKQKDKTVGKVFIDYTIKETGN